MTDAVSSERRPDPRGTVARWGRFMLERFPPAGHLPMIAVFTLANAAAAARTAAAPILPGRLAAAFAVTLLFFFRLRCFDELKDLAVDRSLNPHRPLARGLLTPAQVKETLAGLVLIEAAITAALGRSALIAHTLATAFSLLMYREFFIGRWLRPRLLLYAVTHTFVSMLLGLSVAAQVTGRAPWACPPALYLFLPVNWMLFNVFEFARKTFAPAEETEGADSYSSLYGARGAVALCLSQAAVAVLLVRFLPAGVLRVPAGWPVPGWSLSIVPLVLPAVTGVAFTVRPARFARAYRAAASLYLVLAYALLAWQAAG